MPVAAPAKKVLIVDDDAYIRTIFARKLSNLGLAVTALSDGAEGLEAMNREVFDCILLDLQMPKKDGIALLRERTGTPNEKTPIVVLTAVPRDLAYDWAKNLGAERIVSKSETSPAEVVELVTRQAKGE